MCNFFSFVTDKKDKMYYFNWEQRKKILSNELNDNQDHEYDPDSHSSIIQYIKEKRMFVGVDFDRKFNKWEYNPLTKELELDLENFNQDFDKIKEKCYNLDFKNIIEPLIIKPIINPFGIKCKKVTKQHIELLNKWDSVRNSVWNSVWNSVGGSVTYPIRGSVWDSVREPVRVSVREGWILVWDSVWDSVYNSISNPNPQ